jgi:hypothetical protein
VFVNDAILYVEFFSIFCLIIIWQSYALSALLCSGVNSINEYVYIVFLRIVLRLRLTANVVPRSSIMVTLTMEVIRPSETSVLTRVTPCTTPEDSIFHRHHHENLKPYMKCVKFEVFTAVTMKNGVF